MPKILALYANEMTKIVKKVSIIILMSLMVVGVFGAAFIAKMQEQAPIGGMTSVDVAGKGDTTWQIEQMKAELLSIDSQLQTLNVQLLTASEADKPSIQAQIDSLKPQRELLLRAIALNIPLYSGDWRATGLNRSYALRAERTALETLPEEMRTDAQKARLALLPDWIAALDAAVDGDDYLGYLALQDSMTDADPSLPDGEKGIQKELNAIRRDVGAYDANLETLLMTLANQKKSLLYGLDYTGGSVVPLTADARAKMIDSVAVTVYKIEHRIESDTYTSDPSEVAFMMMNYVGFFLVILLMMILAGGSFSSEISTGSIKSLIVAPVKRWKIYFAKFASILTVGVLASLLLYAVSVLAHGLFFGFGSGAGYVYAANGVARELSFPIYRLAYLAAELAPLLVYMTFAFMMSIVTRNTAASVAISIGVYFASSVSESFLKAFGSGEWLKFLPFNNFNLASRLFPDSLNGQISTYVAAGFPKITVAFSLTYLGVLFLLMLYTGLDSFNRRDIK